MNETIKCMKERRSVRKFKAQQISDQELDLILEAGLWAPNGRNFQSPVLVAVQDPEEIAQLAALNAAAAGSVYPDMDPFYGAPTVVVVLAERERITHVHDGSAALCNMTNAAYSLGVSSCWIHRAKEVFDRPEGKALLAKWGVEGDLVGVGNCILGYCDGDYPAAKPRKKDRVYKVK